MRILAFSDVHGSQSIIFKIREKAKECDLILCCGDITPSHGMTINTAKQIGKFDVKVLAIPGNFETPDDMKKVCSQLGWIDLDGKSIEIEGLTFFGCGGGNTSPFNTTYELTEGELQEKLDNFSSKDRFVFMSHCPSKGFLDVVSGQHVGSEAIAEFVKKTQPLLQFCGHIHEEGGKESMIGKTKVYNVARQVKVVDIE